MNVRLKIGFCLALAVTIGLLQPSRIVGEDEGELDGLVSLLTEIDDAAFQLDLLKGMHDGLRGRKKVAMPKGWPAAYKRLSASPNAEVRRLSTTLALAFSDRQALSSLRRTMLDTEAAKRDRLAALTALSEQQVDGLAADMQSLLSDAAVRSAAIRALARCDDPRTPEALLKGYAAFRPDERQDAITTLSARVDHALAMLDAVQRGDVAANDISAFTVRKLIDLNNETLTSRLKDVWGEIRPTSADKKKLIAKHKAWLTDDFLKKADLSAGRLVYHKTCHKCHKLFGEGYKIGPNLTGSNRATLDYVLENVLDPHSVVGKGYQLTTVITDAGRIVQGILLEQSDDSLTIQIENERIVIPRDEIDEMDTSEKSMMPEGQFDQLTRDQIRDLIAYLASPSQVPLPAVKE